MEYIFGRDARTGCETVRTKGAEHSTLTGFCETVREYPDCTITDSFFVCGHIRSAEDAEGRCYDWYEIDHHYRMTDKTGPLAEQAAKTAAEMEDALCEQDMASEERMAAIEDSLCELDAAVNK